MDEFGEFYGARKDAVFRAVLVAVGDRAVAEDAVAEAFTRAYAQWRRLAGHPNPTAWVLRTALNAQRSWWRRLRREVTGDPPDRPGLAGEASQLSNDIKKLINDLPRRQREVVALRLLADLSADDTAALLGIAPATVHVHLHRALATLRTQLTGPASPHTEEVR